MRESLYYYVGMLTESNKKLKEDALELATLIYDIFKERQADDKMKSGQNNANQTRTD